MLVRPEEPADFDAVRALVAAAFGSESEARLVDLIRASGGYRPAQSLVAVDGGEVVGHVMLSDATLVADDGTERTVAQLSPLAVLPARQKAGIGSALVREACRIADEAGEPFVLLQGSPAYYPRLGFEPTVPHGITQPLPDWAPPEASMLVRLSAFDPAVRGRVVYPPAFDEV